LLVYNLPIMKKDNRSDQYEKDIKNVINYLKINDPKNATREKAVEMLGDMQAVAHLVAHKVVDEERAKKLKG